MSATTTASDSLRSLLSNPSPTTMNRSSVAPVASVVTSNSSFTSATSSSTSTSTTNGTPTLIKREYLNDAQSQQMQSQQESTGDNNNPARKRSKVSRACDPCRRKKIRCNAEYSTNLQRVTKICTNCVKNCEECTFSRIPLKRGPSKGFVRDFDDQKHEGKEVVANIPSGAQHPAAATATAQPPPQAQAPPLIHSGQPLPFPQSLGTSAASAPIKLPPLVGLTNKPLVSPSIQKLNSSSSINAMTSSTPPSPRSYQINGLLNASSEGYSSSATLTANTNSNVSPNTNAMATVSTIGSTNSPPIQGPFWKVPYEMPNSTSSRRSSSSVSIPVNGGSTGSNINNTLRRRSSIDSISSISTNGSRLPSLKPTMSVNSDNYITDSDSEDFYSIKSNSSTPFRKDSQVSSPRNSISSLSSLNGRISKGLYLSTPSNNSPAGASPGYSPYYQHQPYPQAPPQQQQQQQPQYQQFPVVQQYVQHPNMFHPAQHLPPLNSLDVNLQLYYQNFHPSFPILPFNRNYLLTLVQGGETGAYSWVIDLFNHALNNLNNFKQLNGNENIEFFTKLMQIYPFSNFMNDNSLVLWCSLLLIANYSILLNGDVYSMGISWTCSILNDFKILEKFVEYVEKNNQVSGDFDNITLYLTKLYYSLDIIDDIYCLCMGTQKNINQNSLIRFIHSNTKYFIQEDISGTALFKNVGVLIQMIEVRDQFLYEGKYSQAITIQPQLTTSGDDEFSSHFITLVGEKYELINYLLEINHFITSDKQHHDSDEIFETLMDYNLKLIRLVKKLSSSIMNFANFIGTSTSATTTSSTAATTNATTTPAKTLISPLLNISIGQLFKLIKLIKLIIDSLTTLIQTSNHHSTTTTDLITRLTKINNDLSISYNLLNLNLVNLPMGSKTNLIIKTRVGDYKFNFTLQQSSTNQELKQSLNNWVSDFTNSILPFIHQENRQGWY
ncbi:Glucose transport transcription regulator RGT1 [Spathaspora sp. JA1]|nr:Glucose transport transcription regulator RGT1 [Spathaspora sp. JA1]